MSRRDSTSSSTTDDGYTWISSFLNDYDGDLLDLELDVGSQLFFDHMDLLMVDPLWPSPAQPSNHENSPLQLTPFVLSVISDLQSTPTPSAAQDKTSALSTSFCDLLEEAQAVVKNTGSRSRSGRHAATSPRNHRSTRVQRRQLTVPAPQPGAPIQHHSKPNTRSRLRKEINRRLF